MKRLVVSFSGRKDGNCAGIGKYAAQELDCMFVEFADLKAQPCGDCGYECLCGGLCPKADGVFALYDAIAQADECVFVLPNYGDYPCANYFIFAERGTGWFGGSEERLAKYMAVPKKAVVISGEEQENFRKILSYQADRTDCLFLRAKDFGQRSTEGRLAENEEVRALVKAFLEGDTCC